MNRLANETSPYLRQHAANPVDWYPWGDEAFEEARRRDVPVFLSIGYSACHWCHVMAHESFEDPQTAAVMNERFVNVKVDREERPDVDAIYMQATQAMTGSGGWPMSVWLRPDGRPFHAGTYFPSHDRQGMPGFVRVCEAVANAWNNDRDSVDDVAGRLTDTLDGALPHAEADVPIDAATFDLAIDVLWESFDAEWGGFGPAPKFPPAVTLSWLCGRATRLADDDRAERVRTMVTTTLDAMAAGGMYDQIGGGFARYSVDGHWLVPHFEKMLYDNALLVRAYTDGWRLTRNGRYARIVAETIEWALRELRHHDGGFYAAYDADSEGVEGKYYCWGIDELREVAGGDADAVVEFYGATGGGNFVDPHTGFRGNVLHVAHRAAEPDATIVAVREQLRTRRALRVPPGLDDKVILSWNALMVRALAEAGAAFQRADWMEAARTTANFLLTRMRRPSDGRLLRSWQASAEPRSDQGSDGRARHLAYAEDYAALVDALVRLAELDAPSWLEPATTLANDLVTRFHDNTDGGFFTAGSDAPALIVRTKDQMDDATPAASSVAASAFMRLHALTGTDSYRAVADEVLTTVAPFVTRYPRGFAAALDAATFAVDPVREIVIVGAPGDGATEALRYEVASRTLPATVAITVAPDHDTTSLLGALVEGRGPVGGRAAAYVCEQYVCAAPVTEADALGALLDA
ncbi:MAG TPA: thioredoxin domain-containing protein [Acidimicrobiia bacterium]